jgi:hypothetical protein
MGQTCSCPCQTAPPPYKLHEDTYIHDQESGEETPESTGEWTRRPCYGAHMLTRTINHQGSTWHQYAVELSNDSSLGIPRHQMFTCKMLLRPGYTEKNLQDCHEKLCRALLDHRTVQQCSCGFARPTRTECERRRRFSSSRYGIGVYVKGHDFRCSCNCFDRV